MGSVRIISGTLKRRIVKVPPGTSTRPLLSRLRKTLVDILSPRLRGARVLDLFGGSGAIAFELISNGASSAVVVEVDARAARLIKDNARALGIEDSVVTYCGDALAAISSLELRGEGFDIIVIAPPYRHGLHQQALTRIAASRLLKERCLVVVQREICEPCAAAEGPLVRTVTRTYSRTVFDFYETQA